jgi:hypothetical protein
VFEVSFFILVSGINYCNKAEAENFGIMDTLCASV